ncbi:MAG: hypothetical protein LBP86_09145 [Azoarcus sp.]|jgi:hypothetical protein|nr:hypothetical protein [Azoarcus sp.]
MDTDGMASLFSAWVLAIVMTSVLTAPFVIATGYAATARKLLSTSGEHDIRGAAFPARRHPS